jgi:hypothetical protein
MARGSIFNGPSEEFARATMDSSSTNRDTNSESDSDPRDSLNNKNEQKRRYPELFRGTGQNG